MGVGVGVGACGCVRGVRVVASECVCECVSVCAGVQESCKPFSFLCFTL